MITTSFQKFNWSLVVAILFTGLSYGIGFYMGWFDVLNWFEVIAVFTAYSCTFLCVMQSRWNYPIGIISTAFFVYVFWTVGLYASVAVNIYLTFTLIYGWFRWGSDDNTRPVTSLLDSSRWVLAGYVFLAVAAYGLAYNTNILMSGWYGSSSGLTGADTLIFVGSVVAQLLLDNKKLETWFVWLLVNFFALYVYFNAGLYLVFFQYILFTLNTGYGYYTWRKDLEKPNPYPIFNEA